MDIGVQLRSAREAKGLTIAGVAQSTRIPARILEAIERNDSHVLPPRPYGRGSVRAYASEVGLDPEGTVREFFAQFAPADCAGAIGARRAADARTAPAARITPGAILICALIGGLVIGIGRSLLTNETEPHLVGTAGAVSPPSAGTAGVVAAPVPPAADVTAAAAPLTVTLETVAPAWISATVDGHRVMYRTMQPGERESLEARERIRLRIGDAGAVRWRINARPAEPMGASGEVRTVVVTPETAASVK